MPHSININAALPQINAMTQRQVFEKLAQCVSDHVAYPKHKLLENLIRKEEVSLSGISNAVAIPHLKVRGLEDRFVAIASLKHEIDFRALDGKPANLVCLLLSPESHGGLHLRGLSRISRLLRNEELCQKLREARDEDTMKALFSNPDGWLLAA